MQYNLSSSLDKERFKARVEALIAKGVVVDLTEKAFRTLHQNSYLHLLIGVVAMETGNSLQEAKENYFKRIVNPDIFCRSKVDALGHNIQSLRSTSELTKEEMTMAIDRFKRWGAENGIYLPNPGDESLLKEIAIEMGRNQKYL